MAAVTGFATPLPPESLPADAAMRLRRLRTLSWLLDRSIPVGRWRIGLDPIIGLLPGAGDWIGALLSFYVLYEGARLGMPVGVLCRMAGNILAETIVGTVPFLGDLFDFVWQSNTRNLALIEQHYRPDFRARPLRKIGMALMVFFFLLLALIAGLFFFLFQLLEAAFR